MARPRRFDFERDSFAFPNELVWEYRFGPATGGTTFTRREPRPAYSHRCFVLARGVRQFLYHAHFDPSQPQTKESEYRNLIREILYRHPRQPSEPTAQVVVPGFDGLRSFSRAWEGLLKAECGAAWRSYVLRSHWRMVFPISRRHQRWTADCLVKRIEAGGSAIVHLVVFPRLSINHGMLLFGLCPGPGPRRFRAYDPNRPEQEAVIDFDRDTGSFSLPANHYWAGGRLNVIEIYRDWLL